MKKLSLISLLCILILSSSFVYSQQILMTAEGSKQGLFKADANGRQNQNKIEVAGFEMETASPLNTAMGVVTGRRVHQPILIQKLFGVSSIQFYEALSTNEVLKSVTIEFYKTDQMGKEMLDYTIKLTNAAVISFRQNAGTANASPAGAPRGLTDEIKLIYQSIEFNNPSSKVTARDNWAN